MNIFLTNDDGFREPGLTALAHAAAKRGHHGIIAAPHVQQSARSHAFTLNYPLFVHEHPAVNDCFSLYSVEGTPADCVRVGLQMLAGSRADIVISGMNRGWNLGIAVHYSATFSAAREGAFHHIPSVAVSAHEDATPQMLANFAERTIIMAEKYAKQALQHNTVLNLNYPQYETDNCAKWVQAPLDTAFYTDSYIAYDTPRSGRCFFMEQGAMTETTDSGSDVDFINQGYSVYTLVGGFQNIAIPSLTE